MSLAFTRPIAVILTVLALGLAGCSGTEGADYTPVDDGSTVATFSPPV